MGARNNTKSYYKGDSKSIYFYAELFRLNKYQFDILKRVTRCRYKGTQLLDLEKSLDVCDIMKKEVKQSIIKRWIDNINFILNKSKINTAAFNYNHEYELNGFETNILWVMLNNRNSIDDLRHSIELYLGHLIK